MTRPFATIFDHMISGDNRHHQQMLDASTLASADSEAAPVRITASIVMLLTTCMIDMNQDE